ncbi:MAG: wax ester/triacylglycerol synthase family O-acyltransferase, partial [Gammaproteobacteria bacterium]|nr:wax ester/triacylglycerol synthase family O-acyltransferase [Gammaproteobacteria bacterium]
MYRLHGRDANFLYQETPTAPMHTMKIYLLEIPADSVLNWEGIVSRTEAMLDQMPMLRQRPVFVPFGLHHPVMIEDPDFDLEYHICRAALPAPGGMRELEAMVAQIASHPLDQHRPLWEIWIIEGLADGRLACVQKIHHTLADGMASVGYITKAWSSGALDDSGPPSDWVPEEIPSRRRLLWDALVDHVKFDARNLPRFLNTLWHAVRGMQAHAKLHPSPTMRGLSGDLPRCRWNYALSPKRAFATVQLSLDEVRTLKNKLGGTVNDVVLALAATSLRQFLIGHDELPGQPLVASIPVSTDEKGAMREFGNRTAAITTLLHVNIADPLERYQAIRESTNQGKAELDIMGKHTYGLLMHYTPPVVLQWISQSKFRKRKANNPKYLPPSNMSISN